MPVIYKNKSESKVVSGTSITITIPTGWAVGDLLIAYIVKDDDVLIDEHGDWTTIQRFTAEGQIAIYVAYRIAQSGDTQWTWTGDSESYYGVIINYKGHDPDNPIYDSGNATGDNISPTSPSVNYTDLTPGSIALQVFGADRDRWPYSYPTGDNIIRRFMDYNSGAGGCGGAGIEKSLGSRVIPTSHNDPSNKWNNETQGYDDDTSTTTSTCFTVSPQSWSGYIEFLHSALDIVGLRYNANRNIGAITKISIDVWYNGYWQNIYESDNYPSGKWISICTGHLASVTKMRIKMWNDNATLDKCAAICEVDFIKDEKVTSNTGITIFGIDAIDEWGAATIIIKATEYIDPYWVSPNSHNDPDSKWTDEILAYDRKTTTGASSIEANHYLEFILSEAILCDMIKMGAYTWTGSGAINFDCDIDVYYEGGWHNIYSGIYPDMTFREILTGVKLISKARIKWNSLGGGYDAIIAEFYFRHLPDSKRFANARTEYDTSIIAVLQLEEEGPIDRTGKASITSSFISILSRGKIEGATGKASITSSMISVLSKGLVKDANGKASIDTSISAILTRGKIENVTAKAEITTNVTGILSRGKIENASGKAGITSLIQTILSNFIDTTGKASINTNVDITLARGKIEGATGKANINSSIISILSRGRIETVTGKSSITSNMESILSRGKIENTTGKASISSLIVSILSRGKVENTTGKADIETSMIIVLRRGGIKNAAGKADISTNIDSQIRIIRKATAKSSITSLIDIALSRGKIENATGKANINSSIIIALSRGRIESITGRASITSEITAVLSRGQIESATGKASINTIFDTILNKGIIENASGRANIISNLIVILQKEGAIDAIGKASITTNIEAGIKRIIARAGKASLETSYNAIISKGKIENVNGKAFIYTSINVKLSKIKRATGKASINSFINIPLKRLINASGKSMFDTLIEIEITRQFAFCQATLGITINDTKLSVKRTETKLGITEIENNINIER